MKRMLKVIKMEFKMTAANKAFIIITILGPFLLLGVTVLPSLLAQKSAGFDEGTVVAIVGADDKLKARFQSMADQSPMTIVFGAGEEAMREAILEKQIEAFVVVPEAYVTAGSLRYFSATGTDFMLRDTVRSLIGNAIVSIRMEREGLDPERIAYLSSRPSFETVVVSRSAEGGAAQDEFSVIMTAIAFVMLLYMTILLHGQSAARSVLKEKASKTVEIMLSSLKPSEMLFGKIFGQAAAGLLQYAFWISTAALLIEVIGPAANLTLPLALNGTNLLYLVVFFILAFFIYSSAYEAHLGQLSWPIMIFLIVPMVMVSAIIMNPEAPFVVFLSLFPLTAPIVMFERLLFSGPPAWQVVLCVAILIASVAGITFASAKIFRVGILMTGKRFKFGEVLKWVRYKAG